MKTDRYYRIGGLLFRFCGWEPPASASDWLPVFAAAEGEADIRIDVRKVGSVDYPPSLVPEWEEPYLRSCRADGEVHRWFRRQMNPSGSDYAHLHYREDTPHLRTLEVCERGFEITERQILAVIGSEELFLRFGRAVFHSSCVDIGGQALLFSGVSGIGKSTQAALWEKYAGAAVKNGDRNLLRACGGTVCACGLPYAGTSGICSAFELPVRAIVFLGQGASNVLRRLPEKEAAKAVLKQLPVPGWDADSIGRAMDTALRTASSVPVYELVCLPEQSAVELLKNELARE